ncbi:hypothetical protein PRZ48_010609 [Zasmidium cellare]|uniref:NmrA-like domain-containing protein n=1 Tax=Zasmidium cellare TaxID=395010 RepID=A0ABR0EA25_ZASCE|nr:hypothetical protein PRZ48_010609 [Zasmidium cellare]
MPKKLIVVVGVTGVQGGSVARLYAREPGWKVRGITRDVSKPSNAALRELGIELVQADLDDPVSLERAFEGANIVFAVTDFWQFIRDPSVLKEAEKTRKRLNEIACEREVQQGKNIIDVVSKLTPPLDRFVLSTLSNSERVTSGKVKWNLHFDGKGRYTDYLKATYPDLAAKTSYLYIGVYLDTWKNPLMRPVKKDDGTFALQLLRNQGDLPIPYLNAQNDTAHFVKALITSPQPTAVLGGSRFLTVVEFWRLWAKIKNVNLVEEVVDRIGDERIPAWLQEEMADSKTFTQSYGWAGGDPDVKRPEEIGVEMGKLTDIERWIEEEAYEGFL